MSVCGLCVCLCVCLCVVCACVNRTTVAVLQAKQDISPRDQPTVSMNIVWLFLSNCVNFQDLS